MLDLPLLSWTCTVHVATYIQNTVPKKNQIVHAVATLNITQSTGTRKQVRTLYDKNNKSTDSTGTGIFCYSKFITSLVNDATDLPSSSADH